MCGAEARIDAHRLRTGRVNNDDWAKIIKTYQTLAETKVFIDDTAGVNIVELRAKSRRLAQEHGLDLLAIVDRPGLFVVGFIWIAIHASIMLGVGRLIRAPFFFVAVGSQANIGGAASAPVVASAFHPVLAPVGVMMAVLGYAVGTYAAWICGLLMQSVAP